MTKDEALKKAFKQAFQLGQDYWYQADHEYVSQNKKSDVTRAKFEQLMEDAIKEALAQPEQEPYGWYIDGYGSVIGKNEPKSVRVGEWLPWYTTPPQRKPLTDEEIDRIWGSHTFIQAIDRRQQAFARAIEAAHGIKGEA